jgi:hypothetical protein
MKRFKVQSSLIPKSIINNQISFNDDEKEKSAFYSLVQKASKDCFPDAFRIQKVTVFETQFTIISIYIIKKINIKRTIKKKI